VVRSVQRREMALTILLEYFEEVSWGFRTEEQRVPSTEIRRVHQLVLEREGGRPHRIDKRQFLVR
jgi:hypothetical protein